MHDGSDNKLSLDQAAAKDQWTGQWIWLDQQAQARNAYALFRRRFTLAASTEIELAITADSFYELHVDGLRVGRGPARSHLQHYSFDRHTLKLAAGPHLLAVLVHHIGVQNACVMTGRPGLLVEVAGAGATFGSDASWRCLPATAWRRDLPCLMSHFGFWEECDLTRLPNHWTSPAYDDAQWQPACVIGDPPCTPWTRLIEPDIPPPRQTSLPPIDLRAAGTWQPGQVGEDNEHKRRTVAGGWLDQASTLDIPSKQVATRRRQTTTPAPLPTTLTPPPNALDGHWLTVDFGRTVSGYPELTLDTSEAGAVVDLAYDDVLRPDGTVDPERSYARLADRFILPAGRTVLRPVNPRGFRFVTIDLAGGGTIRLHSLRAIEETYPFAEPAAFAAADPRLATYARRAAETVRICSTDAFTDCASRERVQWMEDLYLHGRVAAYAFGDTTLLRRALFQAAQNALPDGRINGFMPSERTGCAFASSSLMWLHALADYRRFAADQPGCRQLLPTARKLLDFIATQTDPEGLIHTWPAGQFWDWSPIEGHGCLLLTNAFYLWALERLADDNVLAEATDPHQIARLAHLRQTAHQRFWDEPRGLYRDAPENAASSPIFSQHANALAVLSAICPEPMRIPLLEQLTDATRLGPLPVGEHSLSPANRPAPDRIVPVGTLWFGQFLCQALFEAGLDQTALEQMHLLWGAFPDAPTFPETRLGAGNTTQCHGWAAGPAWLLPAYVLGARPTAPGWSQAIVAPHPGNLQQASGSVPTPNGPLNIHWQKDAAGNCRRQIDSPPGTTIVP